MELEYLLLDPTGNMTLLVLTPVAEPLQAAAAALLLRAEPEAEQVGYLLPPTPGCHTALRMAGGEFCGNAAMSAAALRCMETGATAETSLRVSVSGTVVTVTVTPPPAGETRFACAVEMPRPLAVEDVRLDGARLPLVRFDGIAHIILPGELERSRAEESVRRWCAMLEAEALGLMLVNEADSRLTPLVWVPGADTLYWERSCASGTAAAGAYLASISGAPVDLTLREPGGCLQVSAAPDGRIVLRGGVCCVRRGRLSAPIPEVGEN